MKPEGTPAEVFTRILDATIALLDPDRVGELEVPDDDLHREILLPLLPAMLGDKVIQQYWREQTTTGYFARLGAHLMAETERPVWGPADFEIHVAASYSAGPDAKALADTLLSEESMRDLAAALMNQLAEPAWAQLPVRVVGQVDEGTADVVSAEVVTESDEPVAVEEEPRLKAAVLSKPEPSAAEVKDGSQALRPALWNHRKNPIRCGSSLGFTFPNWLAVNPLKPWKSDGPI